LEDAINFFTFRCWYNKHTKTIIIKVLYMHCSIYRTKIIAVITFNKFLLSQWVVLLLFSKAVNHCKLSTLVQQRNYPKQIVCREEGNINTWLKSIESRENQQKAPLIKLFKYSAKTCFLSTQTWNAVSKPKLNKLLVVLVRITSFMVILVIFNSIFCNGNNCSQLFDQLWQKLMD